jgi:hypothetical protein
MFKKISLAVVALVLMAGSAFANDIISGSDIELASIQDANNAVVEASIDVDLDEVANGDKVDEAVEACFRGWFGRGCCYNYNHCYNYCYTPCYHYCYRPVVYHTYCYQPVCYTTYSYGYLGGWGCY